MTERLRRFWRWANREHGDDLDCWCVPRRLRRQVRASDENR